MRLCAPGRGRCVRSDGGQRAIFDGPFLESKEVIGGLCFVRMSTIDEAVRWATATAFVKYGVVEIRELWRSRVVRSTRSFGARRDASWARSCGSSGASTRPRNRFKVAS